MLFSLFFQEIQNLNPIKALRDWVEEVLYQLAKYGDVCMRNFKETPAQAIIYILDHIQSLQDYYEVLANVRDLKEEKIMPSKGLNRLMKMLSVRQDKRGEIDFVTYQDQVAAKNMSTIQDLIKDMSQYLRFEALKAQAVNTMGLVHTKAFEQQQYDDCIRHPQDLPFGMTLSPMSIPPYCKSMAIIKTKEKFGNESYQNMLETLGDIET